jgi:membrane protein implicated in regulation of membrane protease activity
VSPVNGFLSWWDGVELWLSGLGFAFQSVVLIPVVLVLAYVIAAALDAMLGRGIQVMRRVRHNDEEPG